MVEASSSMNPKGRAKATEGLLRDENDIEPRFHRGASRGVHHSSTMSGAIASSAREVAIEAGADPDRVVLISADDQAALGKALAPCGCRHPAVIRMGVAGRRHTIEYLRAAFIDQQIPRPPGGD